MLKLSNSYRTIKTDTILKNRQDLQSQTSIRYLKLLTLFVFLTSVFLLNSCSSPESDGIKAAKKYCDCINDSYKNTKNAYELYIKQFASHSFKTRSEAREKLNEYLQKANDDSQKSFEKANIYRNELGSKYNTNKEKADKFQYAFDAHGNAFRPNSFDDSEYRKQIEGLIQTIIPPIPDLEKIKRDLIGSYINYEYGVFYRNGGFYTNYPIEENNLKDIQIVNSNKESDDCLIKAQLILQSCDGGLKYEGIVNLNYVLPQYDDWILKSKEFNILKTGKYDNCITCTIKQYSQRYGEINKLNKYYLEFTNHCDIRLLVGGKRLVSIWDNFSIIINGNTKQDYWDGRQGDFGRYYWDIKDYEILFVESI